MVFGRSQNKYNDHKYFLIAVLCIIPGPLSSEGTEAAFKVKSPSSAMDIKNEGFSHLLCMASEAVGLSLQE